MIDELSTFTLRRRVLLRAVHGAGVAALPLGMSWSANGQEKYPSKVVRIVVPYTAGSPTDTVGRYAAEKLSTAFAGTFIVDNHPGAGGTIGTSLVSHAAPDGYTLMLQANSLLSSTSFLYRSLSYDIVKDFVPIWGVRSTGYALIVNPLLPYKSVEQFIAYARAHPGDLRCGSAGNGTGHHLAAELFMRNTGIKMIHVPYRGGALAENDLMGGQIECMFDPISAVYPFIVAGKVLPLAVLRVTRARQLPNVPTMKEAGVQGMDLPLSVIGLYGRRGMPDAIVTRMTVALMDAYSKDKEGQINFEKVGLENAVDGAETGVDLSVNSEFWKPLIASLGITLG
jgi:tripartite-type tricarboxylate transporter receptor subunit TctC